MEFIEELHSLEGCRNPNSSFSSTCLFLMEMAAGGLKQVELWWFWGDKRERWLETKVVGAIQGTAWVFLCSGNEVGRQIWSDASLLHYFRFDAVEWGYMNVETNNVPDLRGADSVICFHLVVCKPAVTAEEAWASEVWFQLHLGPIFHAQNLKF